MSEQEQLSSVLLSSLFYLYQEPAQGLPLFCLFPCTGADPEQHRGGANLRVMEFVYQSKSRC